MKTSFLFMLFACFTLSNASSIFNDKSLTKPEPDYLVWQSSGGQLKVSGSVKKPKTTRLLKTRLKAQVSYIPQNQKPVTICKSLYKIALKAYHKRWCAKVATRNPIDVSNLAWTSHTVFSDPQGSKLDVDLPGIVSLNLSKSDLSTTVQGLASLANLDFESLARPRDQVSLQIHDASIEDALMYLNQVSSIRVDITSKAIVLDARKVQNRKWDLIELPRTPANPKAKVSLDVKAGELITVIRRIAQVGSVPLYVRGQSFATVDLKILDKTIEEAIQLLQTITPHDISIIKGIIYLQ